MDQISIKNNKLFFRIPDKREIIVNLIKRAGKISRVEISKLTGIKAPSLTGIIHELINKGIISECESKETTDEISKDVNQLSCK